MESESGAVSTAVGALGPGVAGRRGSVDSGPEGPEGSRLEPKRPQSCWEEMWPRCPREHSEERSVGKPSDYVVGSGRRGHGAWPGRGGLGDLRNGWEVSGGGGGRDPVHQPRSGLRNSFPAETGSAASLTVAPAGLSPAARCEGLSGRLTAPLPAWSVGTRRPERRGRRVPVAQAGPDTNTERTPERIWAERWGEGQKTERARQHGAPPRAAGSQSACATRGPRG